MIESKKKKNTSIFVFVLVFNFKPVKLSKLVIICPLTSPLKFFPVTLSSAQYCVKLRLLAKPNEADSTGCFLTTKLIH